MEPNKDNDDDLVLRILHFNDVYDVQPNQKTNEAGAYHFKAHLDSHRNSKTITLFSGDAFSPSILSTLFDGWQMVHCLNQFKIDAACYGNHQFDYEIEHTEELARGCNFPWLLGNLIDKRTEEPLGQALDEVVLVRNGVKIGLFGVAEEDWLSLLTEDYQGQLDYIDIVKYSDYKVDQLRNKQECDIVIALTHMRVPNDKKLCQEVQDIDFALGGHDHIIYSQKIGKVHMLKSGSNFYNYSVIDIYPKTKKCTYQGQKYNYEITIHNVKPMANYDVDLKKFVDEKLQVFKKESERIVGYTNVALQTRFAKIRTQQTNYGNFITDLVRAFYNCDCVAINSGGVRIDQLIPPGPIKFSMISNIFDDFLVIKLIPGHILLQMLENSCCKYPAYEGRFLLVSGIRYTFDSQLPPGSRVIPNLVFINNKPLDLKREYKVAMHSFTAKGGDGYDAVKDCKYSVTMENAIRMIPLLQRFYRPVEQGKQLDLSLDPVLMMNKRRSSKSDRMSKYADNVVLIEDKYYVQIAPRVQGRVNILNPIINKDEQQK